MKADTHLASKVEAMRARLADLERDNVNLTQIIAAHRALADAHRELLARADTERNKALTAVRNASCALDRLVAMEAEAKHAREDEAWANDRTVLVEFQPLTSGWYASAPDGVVGINATAPTIHGALRALREKMEGAR